jgi:hypothetical protein
MSIRFFVTNIIFLFFVSVCVADSASVRDGTDAFNKKEFEQAAKAFQKAAENSPNDSRLIHNHGVALAASGNLDDAIELLRKSALDPNPKIAAASLNSLAQIYIDKAKQLLPKNPAETPPDQRNTIIELIGKSEQYYTDILAVNPQNETIKHNIEQLRTWKSGIESQWNQFDRNQKRQSELFDRLNWIDNWQRDIANSISQSKELSNSPKKYQNLYESAGKQQQIIDEINAVENDLKQQLTQNNLQNSQESNALIQAINNISNAAANTKKSLDQFDENNAQKNAELTNKQLKQLKFSIAPFEKIVEEAEKIQTQLVNNNPSSEENNNNSNSQNPNQNYRNDNSPTPNLQQQITDQQLVAALTPLMLYRAKEGLAKIQNQQSQVNPAESNSTNPNPAESNPAESNPASAQVDPRQKSMELAIKYEPEIRQLAEESATLLAQNKFDDALPKQKQAQKLLREILNQQNQNQDQNQQNQDQNKDQNQNQNQNQNQDQQNQNDQNKQSENENDKNDQNQNEQKNNQSQSADDKKNEQKENNLTKEEKLRQEEKAERLMRQVKRKQQEANERREELRYLLLQPAPIDKDW